ncbi:MAG: hypothetical protein J2P55_02095 [Rhizobiales bacterium]|nr:hypothetical protein [Hyphomicrobiales bacterium]
MRKDHVIGYIIAAALCIPLALLAFVVIGTMMGVSLDDDPNVLHACEILQDIRYDGPQWRQTTTEGDFRIACREMKHTFSKSDDAPACLVAAALMYRRYGGVPPEAVLQRADKACLMLTTGMSEDKAEQSLARAKRP